MAVESQAARARRAATIFELLRQTYPDAHCELQYSNPLELLIATILSAQCSDTQVNKVTQSLFTTYRSAADYAAAPLAELERAIQRIGLFRNKARHIQRCALALARHHNSQVPDRLDQLIALDGVGRKTANVVLGNAFGRNEGVVVDTHVARLAQRLRLSRHQNPVRIEQDLMQLAPRHDWTLLSHWLIWHGRRRCTARNPHCAACEIRKQCPSALPAASP